MLTHFRGDRTATAASAIPGKGKPNRLIKEKSPYLLQHAYNPVDWYAWGEEAFKKARKEDKPIFLSIGYSTCHWCHVMEHESFENEAVAKVMNEHFVSIKMDREERPDLDSLYMSYVQSATGRGGWPMSVWLTPDLKPFMGGTYYPPEQFTNLLLQLANVWKNDRGKVTAAAESAASGLQRRLFTPPVGSLTTQNDEETLHRGYRALAGMHDARLGGFGGAPKFPRPVVYTFLFRYDRHFDKPRATEMTLHTLRAMAQGGMYDHLGGGFHRYSTDARWHVPHFEKMLYDQAQLVFSYLEAYQLTQEPAFRETAQGILDYVRRDMTSPKGGFYSAEDADSAASHEHPEEKTEGAFYVWARNELDQILGEADAELFSVAYGVERDGNVARASDPRGELTGKNILYAATSVEDLAKRFKQPPDEIQNTLRQVREKLFSVRAKRPRPHLDDKVLTAWNGLMISAFARAAWALDEPQYLKSAQGAADFVLDTLYVKRKGTLLRRYRDGDAAIDAFTDDYAFLIQGLLDLYEADGNIRWLRTAITLQETQDKLFWDTSAHGYFTTDGRDSSVLARQKELYDGAEPAGNSVAAGNLLRLAQMTDRKDFSRRAQEHLVWCSNSFREAPHAHPLVLAAALFNLGQHRQVVLAGSPAAKDLAAMRRVIGQRFLPNTVILYADGGKGQKFLAKSLRFLEAVRPLKGKATAYVCVNYTCDLPTTDLKTLEKQLDSKPTTSQPLPFTTNLKP